jgi:SAM-dependent methyltransferase
VSPAAHDPTAYGRATAADYDDMYEHAYDTAGAVEFLAARAGGRPVLELGIGTGRLALPLVERGIAVSGVDASPDMVELLAQKPGGASIVVTIGDFADADAGRDDFGLVVLAINTIFAVPTQAAQVGVFVNAARHLARGGSFIVEAWVPDLERFHRDAGVWVREHTAHSVSLEIGRLDKANQRIETTQIRFGARGVQLYPANHRYAWPCELDLMAQLAGLTPVARYEDWRETPFTSSSWTHVSVYRKP